MEFARGDAHSGHASAPRAAMPTMHVHRRHREARFMMQPEQ
jgi:hypothetical protein